MIEGAPTLNLWLDGEPLPPAVAAGLGERLAAALLRAGRAHGRLHPGVISLDEQADLRIEGFGVSGAPLPDYEAPGQTDTALADADVYALGAILYEALSGACLGRLPDREILHGSAVERALLPLVQVPSPLLGLLRAMLSHRKSSRPSLRMIEESLARMQVELGGPALVEWVEARGLPEDRASGGTDAATVPQGRHLEATDVRDGRWQREDGRASGPQGGTGRGPTGGGGSGPTGGRGSGPTGGRGSGPTGGQGVSSGPSRTSGEHARASEGSTAGGVGGGLTRSDGGWAGTPAGGPTRSDGGWAGAPSSGPVTTPGGGGWSSDAGVGVHQVAHGAQPGGHVGTAWSSNEDETVPLDPATMGLWDEDRLGETEVLPPPRRKVRKKKGNLLLGVGVAALVGGGLATVVLLGAFAAMWWVWG